MKFYNVLGIAIIVLLILVSGCIVKDDREKYLDQIKENGSGNVIKEDRYITGFNYISFHDDFFITNLIIDQGNEDLIEIEAEDNIIHHIKTEFLTENVTEPFLSIQYDANMPKPTKPILIHITCKKLNTLNFFGEGNTSLNNITSDNLIIRIERANCNSSLNDIKVDKLEIKLNQLSKMDVIGSANTQNVTTGSGSIYQADKLESKIADVHVDGNGKVTVKVTDLLNVEMNSNGELYYLGNPQINWGNHNKGKIVKMT
nr:DUF2807 domain-containing protein [uncultured Methanobacterium sp.]